MKTGRKVRLYRILARPELRSLSPAGLALFFLLNGAVRASRMWGAAQGLIRRFLNSDNTDNTDHAGEDADAHCFGISFQQRSKRIQRSKCIEQRGEQTDRRRRKFQTRGAES